MLTRLNLIDRHVGARVSQRRVQLGMSQEKLGELIGPVTFQQVQKYESGKNRVAASRLFEMARVLDVEVGYFFDGLKIDAALIGRSTPEPSATDLSILTALGRIKSTKLKRQLLALAKAAARIDDGKDGPRLRP
jgi:transcriptional regulator with XRE-family HTH domain